MVHMAGVGAKTPSTSASSRNPQQAPSYPFVFCNVLFVHSKTLSPRVLGSIGFELRHHGRQHQPQNISLFRGESSLRRYEGTAMTPPIEDIDMDLFFTCVLIAVVAITFGTLGFLSGFLYQGSHPMPEHKHTRQPIGSNHGATHV